jgi:uncharacterized protein (TIGR03437 family)
MTKTKSIVVAFTAALFIISGSAQAQSISIVSGNGQLACQACPTKPITIFNPIVVQVKDASGKPLPGATVSWKFASTQAGFGNVISGQTVTDANGQSSNTFSLTPALGSLFGISFVQATITATLTALPAGTTGSTGQSVVFTETNALTDIQATSTGTGIIQLTDTLISPQPGTVLTGPAGSTSAVPIQIKLAGFLGGGVPGVAVIVVPPTDPTLPTISCATTPGGQPNTAITDASGTATCNVVFGGRTGLGQALVAVGQTTPTPFDQFSVSFSVLPGVPGTIVPTTGNNQSGNAGALLPAPLVAVVGDQAGNPLSGVDVTWSVVPATPPGTAGTGTLSNIHTPSDSNGRVSANLTLGSTPGVVQVKVAVTNAPQISATFTETVNLAVSAFSAVSGTSQSTPVNTQFAAPLMVQVTNNGQPVAGVTVNFAVTSGSVTLGTPNAVTNAAGQAQTTVQAGATAGPAVVTATIGTFSTTFNLTVAPPGPALTTTSFQNAASSIPGAISPCSLATIVAQGVASGIQGAILPPVIGALPLLLNNTTVAFLNPVTNSNIFAPIWDVANINGQESMTIEIPCELSPGTVSVTVSSASGSKSVNLQLQPAAPGIFQVAGSDQKQRAVVVRPDGSFASRENPARRGETVHLFVTGLGPVNPAIGTNQIGIPDTDSIVTDSIVIGVNNAGVAVTSAKYARDLVGVYDVAFVVPADAPAGDVPLAIAVSIGNTLVFGQASIIPIQ